MTNKDFDVIVIGGGPAGLSAASWCDELGLTTLILEAGVKLGGQLNSVFNPIENHLGVKASSGAALLGIFLEQVKRKSFTTRLSSHISKIDIKKSVVRLTGGECFGFRALIIATGVRRRTLDIPGEKEFADRGILVSGKRDQESVRNKTVVIVGGGDAAFENSLILAETASKVILAYRGRNFRARDEFVEKVKANSKVEILLETEVKGIFGDQKIEYLEVYDAAKNKTKKLKTDAVLLRIGVVPNSEIFSDLIDFDNKGYIKISARCEASVPNIYAVGDVSNPISPTVSSAVGMGATAAKAIRSNLRVSC